MEDARFPPSQRDNRRRSRSPRRRPSRSPERRSHDSPRRQRSSRSPAPRSPHRRQSRSPPPRSPLRRFSRSPQRRNGGGFRWKDKHREEEPGRRGGERNRGGLERGYREQERRRPRSPVGGKEAAEKPPRKENKEKKPTIAPVGEPMIIVNVNDRLGTKASIPCLASDPIKLFKAQVAARIGREPHEIMLKRQGERPFKDHLTLEDYGVSNGVQLDLEVDTGD